MTFKLPDHIAAKYAEARASEEARRAVFANLDNGDLAASAQFWLAHCEAPRRFNSSEPIYDATFYHIIVPELIKRLKG